MTKKDSQEGKDAQEQQDSLINEFSRISSDGILRSWEEKNRERIAASSLAVRDAFDQKWKKLIGRSYYEPVTTQPVVMPVAGQNNTERSDPRGCGYRENIEFSSVEWQKLPRRKIGKRFTELFNLKGIAQSDGKMRPIFQNLSFERLEAILGVEAKDKIKEESKKIDHGELKGPFGIDVEGYWEVVFSPKSQPHDTKDVRLMWEGQCLIIQRMQHVVLPGFYIEVADNALRDQYTQTPEDGRKKVGTIQEYPYTTVRRATRGEYLVQKSAGDKIQREARSREENG